MSRELAKAHFLGKNGWKKLNCGQAVVRAFKDTYGVQDEMVARFEGFGGGRAPGGECGALHAAKVILGKSKADLQQACEDAFVADAGSPRCKDIRALRKLTCLGCVEKAAAFLEGAR